MVSVRRYLTMRAAVERDVQPGDTIGGDFLFDGYEFGGTDDPAAPATPRQIAASMPCFVWGNTEQTLFDDDKTVSIGDYTMLVGYRADVKELDMVTAVRDRRGGDFLGGVRMRVLKVIPRRGWGPQTLRFKEIMLETTGPAADVIVRSAFIAVSDIVWGDADLLWGDTDLVWGGSA